MPELSMDRRQSTILVSGIQKGGRPERITYPSEEALEVIYEAAYRLHTNPKGIEIDLLAGETVEF